MIAQERFFNLLAAADWYVEKLEGLHRYLNTIQMAISTEQITPEHGFRLLMGYCTGRFAEPLPSHLSQAIANERAHFQANAKRNERARQYRRLKKDLARHNEHIANTAHMNYPWRAAVQAPPIEPMDLAAGESKQWTQEELQRMQDAAAAMPGPVPSAHEKAIAEAKAKLEAAAKRHGINIASGLETPRGYVFKEEEILGDTDGTEDPFA